MKAMLGYIAVLPGLALVAANRGATSVTPVQKAVQMLEGMLVKSKKTKHEENVQYSGFKEFCDNVQVSKKKDITDADDQIGLLKADIEKADSEVARLKKEIAGHESDITGWDKDAKDSTKVRDSERATYLVEHRDYSESIEAIGQAMIMLKKQDFDRPAKSLLQKVSALGKTPEDARNAIQAFLEKAKQSAPDPDDDLGYKATAYKFQSGAIIDMLEKLQGEFKDELTKLEKKEVERRQAYDMLSQDLTDQRADGEKAITEKTMTQNKQKQTSIEKSGDLKEVSDVRAADAKYLADLTSLCGQKAKEFAARTKTREEEIEALEKAVEILSGDDVGDADKRVQSFVQQSKSPSFAQLRSAKVNPSQERVAAYLRDASVRLDSHVLSTLAMEAAADPFVKVKKLIQELIERLMQEATNEAEHKGWCDKELATNKNTRESKSAEVDTLTSTIEGLDADIKSLKKDIAKKTGEVAKIEADVADFTKKREKETADNAAAVKDAQEGQKAIAQAIKVLEDFYAKAAKGASLAQTSSAAKQPPVPEIFDDDFKGQQDAKGGVIGMLDVIKSDFARLEADTKSSEAAAQSEYDDFMSDSAATKASLEVDLKHNKANKDAKEGELTVAKDNLVTSQKTLDSALAYFDKLKEPCLGGGQTYAERKARRKQEIESLKEALKILTEGV